MSESTNRNKATLEISMMQNMLEWLLPNEIKMDLNDPDYMEEFVWWMHNRQSENLYEYLKIEGFAKTRGSLKDVDEIIGVSWDEKELVLFRDKL